MKSPLWFVMAALVALGGIAVAVVDMLPRLGKLDSAMTRLAMPGTATLNVAVPCTYTIYRETPADGLSLSLVAPSGAAVTLKPDSGRSSYSIGERQGTSIFTFDAVETGAYRVTGTGGKPATLTVEHGFMWEMMRTIFRLMGIVFAGFALAGIIAGVTIWQRTKKA